MGENLKKILITGGAGFIGSRLALKLAAEGHNVIILDNLSPQVHGISPKDSKSFKKLSSANNVEIIIGDVRNLEDWRTSLNGCNIIYHLAAETGTGQSMYQIEKYSAVNVHATALMFQAISEIKNAQLEKIIYASSRAIYGEGKYTDEQNNIYFPDYRQINNLKKGAFELYYDGNQLIPTATCEESKLNPISFYGLTKKIQEEIIHLMAKNFNIVPISLRLQNVYGEGQSLLNPYTGILSIFSNLMRSNEPINIFEDGMESRDFIHVEDVVNAFCLALEKNIISEKIYNVGTGEPTNVLTIANKLKLLLKSKSKIEVSGAFRVGDIRHNYADISKIQKDLKFLPKISIDEGLFRFVNWVKSEKINESSYNKSLSELKENGLYHEQ